MSCTILNKKDKERASRLLIQAPPGELVNVLEDLCLFICDKTTTTKCMHHQGECAGNQNCQKYYVPFCIDENPVLFSHHNVVGDFQIFDYHSKLSFKSDLLQNQVEDIQNHGIIQNETEYLRNMVFHALKTYVNDHYPTGNCNMLRKTMKNENFLIACTEEQCYETETSGMVNLFLTKVTGRSFVQVHFFKSVNLHVEISKNLKESLEIVNQAQLALNFASLVEEQENKFQAAVCKELQLNEALRKILQRDLPGTRTFIAWQRILSDQNLVMYSKLGYVIYSRSVLCNWIYKLLLLGIVLT
ncbi:LOW QUALITY PROTEIN: F-actin-capping protein subunit alpha-3 [Rhynchonycteris naso]